MPFETDWSVFDMFSVLFSLLHSVHFFRRQQANTNANISYAQPDSEGTEKRTWYTTHASARTYECRAARRRCLFLRVRRSRNFRNMDRAQFF